MNFDIIQKSIPEECMRAFLEKEKRYDNRKFLESRKFEYNYGVLNKIDNSAIGSQGLNKIILVLKEYNNNTPQKNNPEPKLNIILDNFDSEKSTENIKSFINKIIKNNIKYKSDEIKNKNKRYELYITIQSVDGNIYEVIANSLVKMFSEENNIDLVFKNKFVSKTICFINKVLLFDPIKQEFEQADFICNIIKYDDKKFMIYKIGGTSIPFDLLKEAVYII